MGDDIEIIHDDNRVGIRINNETHYTSVERGMQIAIDMMGACRLALKTHRENLAAQLEAELAKASDR